MNEIQFFIKPSVHALLFVVFLGNSVSAANLCSDSYAYQQRLYGADYVPHIQAKLGGHASRWHKIFENLNNKPIEDVLHIDTIFKDTQARGWLAKYSNSFRFVRLDAIARTLDRVYMHQIDIAKNKSWSELSVAERRALLLVSFKKWWWEVDSHQVLGFSRWTDVSYLLSRALTEPQNQGRLDLRLHELLGSASQTGFLSSLIGRFKTELRILESLKEQPNARDVLSKTLTERVRFLQTTKNRHHLNPMSSRLFDIQVLRAAVLQKMVEQGRVLKKTEINEVARKLGLSEKLAAEMKWGQLGMSLIPNMNTFINTAIDIAMTTAMAYVIGQYFLDDLQNDGVYRGSFNDLISIEPFKEKEF